jgi:hypothetical protein
MAKKQQLTAEEIAEQITGLEDKIRKGLLEDLVVDLRDSLKHGPVTVEGDVDTWECGFRSAIETITANYV